MAELRAAAANGLGFELRTARSFGRSRPLATLRIGPPLPAEQTEALRFNHWTTGPGIRPAGWLNLLRDTAYRRANAAVAEEQVPATISSRAFTGAEVLGTRYSTARQRSIASDLVDDLTVLLAGANSVVIG